jgi:hypothetical protein
MSYATPLVSNTHVCCLDECDMPVWAGRTGLHSWCVLHLGNVLVVVVCTRIADWHGMPSSPTELPHRCKTCDALTQLLPDLAPTPGEPSPDIRSKEGLRPAPTMVGGMHGPLVERIVHAEVAAVVGSCISGPAPDGSPAAAQRLTRLAGLPITRGMLERGGLGKAVGRLRRHSTPSIAEAAGNVVMAWKRAVGL